MGLRSLTVCLLCVLVFMGVPALADGTLQGFVKNESGTPIEGATVNVINVITATTGSDGSYSIAVPAGAYSVAAYDSDHYTQKIDGVAVTDGETTSNDFSLKAMPEPSYHIVDSFDRADNTDIGAGTDWSWFENRSDIGIAGNMLALPTGGNVGPDRNGTGSSAFLPADFDLSFTVLTASANFAVGFRQDGYAGPSYGNGGYTTIIFSVQNGGAVIHYSTWLGLLWPKPYGWGADKDWSVPHTVRVRAIGNHHEAWFDAEKVVDYFDLSAIAKNTPGYLFVGTSDPYPGGTDFKVDNFDCKAWGPPSVFIRGTVTDAADAGKKIAGATVKVGAASVKADANGQYAVPVTASGASFDVSAYADDYGMSAPESVTPISGTDTIHNISLTAIPIATVPDVYDTFTRNEGYDLGLTEDANHWNYMTTQAAQITDHQLALPWGGNVGPYEKAPGEAFMPADFDYSVKVINPDAYTIGISYRMDGSAEPAWTNNGYNLFIYPSMSLVRLYATWLDERTTIAKDWSVPHTIRIRVFGSHHMAWLDGDKVMDYFDASASAKTAGGYVYMYLAQDPGANPLKWDDLKIASGKRLFGYGTITGTVTEAGNPSKAIAGAKVSIDSMVVTANAEGVYTATVVAGAGTSYSVSASDPLYLPSAAVTVTPVAGESVSQDFSLTPRPAVKGIVTDAVSAKKIVGATVKVGSSSATTDANGAFSVPVESSTSYDVYAYADDYYVSGMITITTPASGDLVHNLTLSAIPVATALTVLDTFGRTDNTDLGVTEDSNHWSWFSSQAVQILGNELDLPNGGNVGPYQKTNGALFFPADFEASMTVTNTAGSNFALGYRQEGFGDPGYGNAGYLAFYFGNTLVTVYSAWTGHVFQAPLVSPDWSIPHKIRVRVFGNHHMAWFDGRKQIDFIDDTPYAKNTGGFLYFSTSEPGTIDFRVDDFKVAEGALLPGMPVASAAEAKAQPIGSRISLSSIEVTKTFGGFFYVEDSSRASGIRVDSGVTVQTGDRVQIAGVTATEGEEIKIIASSVSPTSGTATIKPVGMTNKSVSSSAGLNTVGLLVTVWGRVTQDPVQSSGYILIDDGTGGELKVSLDFNFSAYTYPAKGAHVLVTGVRSATSGNMIRVNKATDIRTVAQ